jgi:type I restriction enzyme R subunit
VKDPETDLEYTEPGMNLDKAGKRISESALRDAFEGDDFQLLLVANKYQTGFDQPLLHTMYVDKRLAGVQAVQTLSRLNRTSPGKVDTFVLDFVNDSEEIQRSFQPYYEATTVAESAIQQLYDLAQARGCAGLLDVGGPGVLQGVLLARERQTVHDQAEMHRHLNPGVDRFKVLDEGRATSSATRWGRSCACTRSWPR